MLFAVAGVAGVVMGVGVMGSFGGVDLTSGTCTSKGQQEERRFNLELEQKGILPSQHHSFSQRLPAELWNSPLGIRWKSVNPSERILNIHDILGPG